MNKKILFGFTAFTAIVSVVLVPFLDIFSKETWMLLLVSIAGLSFCYGTIFRKKVAYNMMAFDFSEKTPVNEVMRYGLLIVGWGLICYPIIHFFKI